MTDNRLDTMLREKGWVVPTAVALVAASILLPLLGSTGLWDPHESLAAELAREAAREGAWMPLRFDGEPVVGLPPLFFWLNGLVMMVAGTSEWAVRLPTALLAVGFVVVAARQVTRLVDRPTGVLAGVALATSTFLVTGARHASPDLLAAMTLTAATLQALICILDHRQGSTRDHWMLHAMAAAVVLSGGVVPLLILVAALSSGALLGTIPAGRLRALVPPRWTWTPWLVVAAWLVAGAITGSAEFLARAFSVRPLSHSHLLAFSQPATASFIWPIHQAGHMAYPWFIALPAALLWLVPPVRDEELDDPSRRTLLHVLVAMPVLVIFIAALFPPYQPTDVSTAPFFLVLTCAWGLCRVTRIQNDEGFRTLLPIGGVLVMLGAGSQGVDFFWIPKRALEVGGYMIDRVYPELGTSAKAVHTTLAILLGLAAAPLTFFRRWTWTVAAVMALGALSVAGYHAFHVFPRMEPYLSVGPLARAYQEARTDRDRLVALELDPQVRGGHVFYFGGQMEDAGGLEALDRLMEESAGKHRLVMVTSHVRDLYNDVHGLSCGRRIDPLNEERRWYSISAFEGAPPMPAYRVVVPGGRAGARIRHPRQEPLYHGDRHVLTFLGHDASAQPEDTDTGDRQRMVVRRGGWLDLSLYWRAEARMHETWRVLLDAIALTRTSGPSTIKGHHLPACGRAPTYDWEVGQVIRDRYFLHIPWTQQVGTYRLRTGIYVQGDRMMTRGDPLPSGHPRESATITLGTLEVKP